MVDNLKDRIRSGVIVLATIKDDKVLLFAGATKDVVAQGVHVGNLIREVAKITGEEAAAGPIWHKLAEKILTNWMRH